MKRLFAPLLILCAGLTAAQKPITVTILHTDDLHAHIEPFKIKNGMYGGYAKHVALAKQFMAKDPNPLLLSGGDTFQGTLYFTVYQGLADLYFLNLMGYRGAAVGNHEFDLGPGALGIFAKNATFPVLACNLDVSQEPELRGVIGKHAIVNVKDGKIGLIGAVTPDLPDISSPGPNVKMLDLMSSIRSSISALQSEGVNKIVLLSHLGYSLEQEVAKQVAGIDVIVGGHSHTLLGTFDNPDFPPSAGPYPTVVKGPDGAQTLLVASWEWGKVFGRIKVSFDAKGVVKSWNGNPITVDDKVKDDVKAASAVLAFSKPIDNLRRTIIAQTETGIDGSREIVRRKEAPMGNVIADAMLEATANQNTVLALMNGGSVRGGLDKGAITFEKVIQVQPFGSTLVVVDLTGAQIKNALEFGVAGIPEEKGAFLHVSKGTSYKFDLTRPKGDQIVGVMINGAPLDLAMTYRTVLNSFSASGGDGFVVFRDASGYRYDTGLVDVDVLVEYLKKHNPVSAGLEGRITGG